MERELRKIYADVANGSLSRQEALEKIKAIKLLRRTGAGSILLTPVWRPAELTAGADHDYDEHEVIPLAAGDEHDLARDYRDCAVLCFERIQSILQSKPKGRVLVQIVSAEPLHAGLQGLLKTAALENPQFFGQVLLIPARMTAEERERLVQRERARGTDPLVTYEDGTRRIAAWEEIPETQDEPAIAFQEGGVYLITGGMGALGLLFARHIVERTGAAKVVLTGRSERDAGRQSVLSELRRTVYRRVDLGDAGDVEQLIAGIRREHGRLDGILHCAGMTADNFILKKDSAEFDRVLMPKVSGTFILDRATRDADLDFFVLFSSYAGAMGNLGQADYATANAFLDQFAAHRNRLVAAGQRHGRTRSINWTLWQAGGMKIDPDSLDALERTTGVRPMSTETGLRAFHRSLALPYAQLLVGEGDLAQMRHALVSAVPAPPEQRRSVSAAAIDPESLARKTCEFLCEQLSGVLKLPAGAIDPEAELERYGIDSIVAMKLTGRLEQTFGKLSKTLFFEYQTIGALTQYFVQSHAVRLTALFQAPAGHGERIVLSEPSEPSPRTERSARRRPARPVRSAGERTAPEPIAIIGLSGRYPEAVDIEAFWRNLRDGKDCIVEVPKERWDWREYFSDDRTRPGHHYSKWGGFISGVDEFDPLFFNISPKEAKLIDPQERLFLQHAWMAVEDAGYTRATLQTRTGDDLAGQVGVYAGLMYSEYQLFGVEAAAQGKRLGIVGSAASVANRVSYVLNLHGPSMTLDTMCSSSLTAIHLACRDLAERRTSLAIAGGVNVSIHPNKYLVLSAGQFISSDGHCQSFGEGGDGYIPGEGVGAVVLKRLTDAERDGDHIYGVIRGSALNHGGKTNGYTVPNPHAQAGAIRRALAEARVDARHVSYIEAHGTGTKLGDPIEIAALSKAFGHDTQDTQFCPIGSVKSNIGHCESAAGIAGLTKVLLQMQHRQIVPSLHSVQLNPHIDFDTTPFVVNQELRPWEQPVIDGRVLPRIAGISSFGAGGSNAHLIIEEYQAEPRPAAAVAEVIVPLSARTPEQLREKARDLLVAVRRQAAGLDLPSVAFTLQVGREAMDERLALVVRSVEELVEGLGAYVAGDTVEGAFAGQAKRHREAPAISGVADLRQTMAGETLSKLAGAWVNGLDLDWDRFYGEPRPRRISLPTYPFARERHWVDITPQAALNPVETVHLHPLLHRNTSDLDGISYSSTFTGTEPFLRDGILTAASQLEMVRAALMNAAPAFGTPLDLCDVVWAEPILIGQRPTVRIVLWPAGDDGAVDYELCTGDGDLEVIHCQGRAVPSPRPAPQILDLRTLERRGERLVPLRLSGEPAAGAGAYVLHPLLLDGALRAGVGESRSPLALTMLRVLSPCAPEMVAWIRPAQGSDDAVDIDLCDARGNVAAQIAGLTSHRRSEEIGESAVHDGMEAPPPVARPAEGDKRTTISLAAPARSVASPAAVPVARPRITLTDTANSAMPAAPEVRLDDRGNGVFALDLPLLPPRDAIASSRRALDAARHQESLRVLLLSGIERAFGEGKNARHDEAVEEGLYAALASFPYPVIAVLHDGAAGAAFIAAALCDFMVCNEDASYGVTHPSAREAQLLCERFGAIHAQDLLYVSTRATGAELRAKGWTCPIVTAAQVAAYADELARTLADKPQEALRLLKQHLVRRLAALMGTGAAGTRIETPPAEDAAGAISVIGLGSTGLHDRVEPGSRAVILIPDDGASISEEVFQSLRDFIEASGVPVIAALSGNATGNTWLVAQHCDACVYSSAGRYSAANISRAAAALFPYRLGNDAGREILLTGAAYRGTELRRRVPTLLVEEPDRVLDIATKVAESWAAASRAELAWWRRQTASMIRSVPAAPEESDPVPLVPPAAPVPIPLQSAVVTATVHPNGVVVVRMEDRHVRNMFSDAFIEGLAEAFAHIEREPACKVVVLTGYDNYFAAGGTKESLLAIHEGKARFTDVKVFQLPLDCRLPVIAAMQGHALGAGWTLGLFADLVLMSEESRYVSPYMSHGFTPGAGATWILAEAIGTELARESLFTGRHYAGSELKTRGVRLSILPRAEVVPAAMDLAGRIARMPRLDLIELKRQWALPIREAIEETYRLELEMHEKTFVGQAEALARISANLGATDESHPVALAAAPAVPSSPSVAAGVKATIRTLLANELQMRESDIEDHAQFVDLGLDSISGVSWIRKINETYGTSIEATKVYSHPTLADLSRHVQDEAEKQGRLVAATVDEAPGKAQDEAPPAQAGPAKPAVGKLVSRRSRGVARARIPDRRESQPIAIIGMAGQFPQARTLDAFWENLAQGRNCISRVPGERWDVNAYYQAGDPVPGKTNSQWLGALDDYDRFDPLFFNISPTEAESMDPQQRLFLQACWHAIEDAAYDARALSGRKCGVFAGCAAGDYLQSSRRHQLSAQGFTGLATSILAARISYFLNLQGPCVSLDTACSSSLVAVAAACDSLVSGGSDLALAGGVYVMAGPEMHIRTAQAGMLSPEGRCFTFDARADGFVPGEGVGVVVLKRLADAERDHDLIRGVIHGWGVNQDGKTNGITAPNPESQTRLMQEVYDRYGIDPAAIQLVEAHGTGTKLGDPIEVEGLKASFAKYTDKQGYCALGSVKSNVGHCLTAAGIAGAIKIVLALEHRQLPPTIHFERLNEHIDLERSPFYVNSQLQEWKVGGATQRQAAISAFGFGGTNAHVVISEATRPPAVQARSPESVIVPLSARTPEQLRQKAEELLEFVSRDGSSIDLAGIAYTLQVGRQAMDERVGFVVRSVEQLAGSLRAYVAGKQGIDDTAEGGVKRGKERLALIDEDVREALVAKWVAEKKLARLLQLWVNGVEFDWTRLYGDVKPQRLRLPLYPFAKDRYWVETPATDAAAGAAAALHPLLHRNTSDLRQQRYASTFHGDEPVFRGQQVLPGVALLEMARAAVEHALPNRADGIVLELRDTVWGEPVVVSGETEISIALSPGDDEQIDFEIYCGDTVHCQGRAVTSREPAPPPIDLAQLERDGQRLLQLHVDDVPFGYALHPALLTDALEGAAPSALKTLRVITPCTSDMVAWVRPSADATAVDIDLCDSGGNVCMQLRGFSSRTAGESTAVLLAAPAWQSGGGIASDIVWAEQHVLRLQDEKTETLAERYCDAAVTCFERIGTILRSNPRGKVLFQVVVGSDDDHAVLAGLSSLLKTAALESSQFTGQILLLPSGLADEELGRILEEEKGCEIDPVVRYDAGTRQVLRWQEIAEDPAQPHALFHDDGVYLVTGGLGALGTLFAREILARAPNAHVFLTGRSASSDGRTLPAGSSAQYRQMDLDDLDDVRRVIDGIRQEHGRLDGILHCAGTSADAFIVNKTSSEFRNVLAPKVSGTYNLDQATQSLELDFFVLFSSVAGPLGNVGQADYAAANGFLDQFAAWRNRLVAAGRRRGRTRSIDWPLWQAGGMALDPATLALLRQTIGVQPMQTATGLHAFRRALDLPHDQMLVLEGARETITEYLRKVRIFEPCHSRPAARGTDAAIDVTQLQRDVKGMVAAVVGIDASVIDVDQAFVELGLDSFLGADLIVRINKSFGTDLSHSRLFDYSTVRALARFVAEEIGKLPVRTAAAETPAVAAPLSLVRKTPRAGGGRLASRVPAPDRIAIIGMSGRYPQANDLRQYWDNLAAGRNSIIEVPRSRWDVDRHYDPDRTRTDRTYSKWLGAVDDVDCFDPLFFRISPQEADYMDPQHRLFLQESYRAFEDAGYSTITLSNRKCGVYLGISTGDYMSLLSRQRIVGPPVTSNSYAIAAARIAYYLNLKGPAISVDTACSSSLVAIHLACQAILNREIDMALAGGVSLWLAPESYIAMSQAGMFSPDGQCKTFDDSANGIVNGEGIGAVVLKRLADAVADGDSIHGVILGSAINQDGRTNGITAPSVNSQIELERSLYAGLQIDPESIGYVETHGTGTKLGDPIELEALATVFREKTSRKNFCALGSVKSNIGHTTAAAGVAGLQKVLLCLRHRKLVPSLNVRKENSRFDFPSSPFYISRETKEWDVAPGSLRRAAISSFGFSGTNAHLVIEEYPAPPGFPVSAESGPFVVPLSARTPEQLRQKARDLLELLRAAEAPVEIAAVAYTLQVGREPMEERLGVVVGSVEDLAEKLRAYESGATEGLHLGRVEPGREGTAATGLDEDVQSAVAHWIDRKMFAPLLEAWTRGLSFDWSELHRDRRPRRVSLPAYPFAKERCWFEDTNTSAQTDEPPMLDVDVESIEDILSRVEADTIETGTAVQALRMLM